MVPAEYTSSEGIVRDRKVVRKPLNIHVGKCYDSGVAFRIHYFSDI